MCAYLVILGGEKLSGARVRHSLCLPFDHAPCRRPLSPPVFCCSTTAAVFEASSLTAGTKPFGRPRPNLYSP